MRFFYKKAFSLACYFFFFTQAWAQDTTNTIGRVSIASPNAASLGKYGDIPVSYHTGLPNVSIPIYTIESGSLKLPVSLSYHASGLKVQEQASWVGAGWSLNAGGMITRTVVGAPDDRGYASSSYIFKGHYSDFGFNSYTYLDGDARNTDNNFYHGYYDGEPDLFFFNFGGYSGKFYFNDDRTPILVPEADFKIQASFSLGPGFTGFIITTPDGVKYYFGKTGNNNTSFDPIETTIPATLQNGVSVQTAAASSWFLNKIISADGMDSINLQYTAESYSYYSLSMSPVISTQYVATDPSKMGLNVVKNFISGARLTQINFPNGSVNFTPSAAYRTDLTGGSSVNNTMYDAANSSAFALGSISISNTTGFCKKDSFYYGYFTDNTALNSNFYTAWSAQNIHSDKYRLRLDSLQELSCDASLKIPPYKFNYFSEPVPRKLSFGVDHWGYYNGADTNNTLVPTYTVYTASSGTPATYNGGNRDASWPAMRGGSLQKITYPTGGSTTFDFEAKNTYTFTTSTMEPSYLGTGVINEYGQSALSSSINFTLIGAGACTINVNNGSTNYTPLLTITNSSGSSVASTPMYINTSYNYNVSVLLPPDNYSATLSFPANSGSSLIGGASFNISQYRPVSTSTSLTVSGLRIKTIINNDGITPNNITTSFDYNGGGSTSTGVLYSRPVYVQIIRNSLLGLIYPSATQNGCYSAYGYGYYVSPSSIQPMATTQGENLGFDEVRVSQTGNGMSLYRYYGSNVWQSSLFDVCTRSITQTGQCDNTIPDYPSAPTPFEFMRGELKYEAQFNNSGLLLKDKYYYPMYAYDSLTTPGHIMAAVNVNAGSQYFAMQNATPVYFTEYSLQSATKIQNTVIENTYDPLTSNAATSTSKVYYNSPFHHQPVRKVMSTSTSDSLITNMKYAMDFRITSCDASIPDSLPYYMNAIQSDYNWMSDSIVKCSPQTNDATSCRVTYYASYRERVARDRYNFIRYRRRSYAPDSANLLSNCYLAALPLADTLLKPVLCLQNEYYNAPVESSEWKDANLLHASYTRFDTSTGPAGFVYPARTKLINLQASSSSFTNATVSGNTIAKDSRYVDESFYTFNKGNPVQVLPRDGVANSYIWDYQNSEPIAKASNAGNTQIAYTSFEADGTGGWNVGSAVRDSSFQMVTGYKSYSLPSGNISFSGLSTTTTYVVSYWTTAAGHYTITGTISGYPIQGKTIGPWVYYEHKITGVTSVTISGGGHIDELRLYPANAQMTTYTYTPLVGMTSACDAGNRVTYYFYDSFGRLKWIKDQDLNIIKTIQYHYASISGSQY